MSPFNRLSRPLTTQTQPNYSAMGHELSSDGTPSMHTQDYPDLSDYLRQSPAVGGDVPGPSDTQTPGVNHQRGLGPRVQVVRGCGTGVS